MSKIVEITGKEKDQYVLIENHWQYNAELIDHVTSLIESVLYYSKNQDKFNMFSLSLNELIEYVYKSAWEHGAKHERDGWTKNVSVSWPAASDWVDGNIPEDADDGGYLVEFTSGQKGLVNKYKRNWSTGVNAPECKRWAKINE